jgi:hypothetical protein
VLQFCYHNNHLDSLRHLLLYAKEHTDVYKALETAIQVVWLSACKEGSLDAVKVFVDSKVVNIDCYDQVLLCQNYSVVC